MMYGESLPPFLIGETIVIVGPDWFCKHVTQTLSLKAAINTLVTNSRLFETIVKLMDHCESIHVVWYFWQLNPDVKRVIFSLREILPAIPITIIFGDNVKFGLKRNKNDFTLKKFLGETFRN